MREKVDILLFLGELLMRSGAAAERIRREVMRTAVYMGFSEEEVALHINYTTLMINLRTEETSYTAFKKCLSHGVNMEVIYAISKIVRMAVKENLPLNTFKTALERAEKGAERPIGLFDVTAAGLTCAGITKLFGGDWMAFIITAVASMFGYVVKKVMDKYKYNNLASTAVAAFVATSFALIIPNYIISMTPAYPMIAATLFLIPGVHLIHSVDDLLNNFIVTGMARMINTLLIVGSMTFGLTLSLAIFNVQDFTKISITPESLYISQSVAAAIAGAGYATIFRVPERLVWLIALGGIIAVDIRNIMLVQYGAGLPLATFIGASVLGLVAQKANHWFKTPSTIFTIPSVIILMPGVLIYRMLFSVQNITTIDAELLMTGIRSGVEAGIVVVAIAVGVTIPTIFFRPILDGIRNRETSKK
ncbi:MAG: threonine/serine exporter family protein [Selenomonadaceae bacterium]|nr:threonine/serine exporter family protein [Selenomonadaceae bacterium]MBR3721148.1 threonine/serine exporter family protein [Selenomonadaceae bacterium]